MKPVLARRKDQNRAIKEVEQAYTTLEDFVLVLVSEFPEFVDTSLAENGLPPALEVMSTRLGVEIGTLAVVLKSRAFESVIDQVVAGDVYGLQERRSAMKNLVRVAADGSKTVMSPQGFPVKVDAPVSEIIKADEHLRALQGRPVTSKSTSGPALVINFHTAPKGEEDDEAHTIEIPFRPASYHDEPPPGAAPLYRHYADGEAEGDEGDSLARFGLDFRPPEAPRDNYRSSLAGEGEEPE